MKSWACITAAGLGLVLGVKCAEAQTSQSGQSNISLRGFVNEFCALPLPTYTQGPGSFSTGSGSDASITLQASDFVDSSSGRHRPLTLIVTYPQAML
jgi:hypothetical protein